MIKKLLFVILAVTCLLTSKINAYTGASESPVYADYGDLPSWFYNPYGVIGVSDMALDSVTAVNQAVVRALFLHSVSKNLQISSVYELYYHIENDGNNKIDNQKSHCLAEFSTVLNGYGYDIIDVYFTRYKEAVVMLNVYEDYTANDEKNATFIGYYTYYFDGTIKYPEYGDALTLKMTAPEEKIKELEWVAKTENRISIQSSTIDTITNNIIEKYYNYGAGGKVSKNAVNQNTRHGLWHCISDTFMQALSNFMPQKAIIKSTNRMITDYQTLNGSADYHDKVQDIVRLTYKTDLSCKINGLECENGLIYADWQVTELNRTDIKSLSNQTYTYESHGYQAVVGYDKSKARNEARRIALVSAENEIAKMADFRISGIADEFSANLENEYYQRYCDTAQISTKLLLRDIQEIIVTEPELNNSVYCSKIKAQINGNNIIQIGNK